MALVYSDVTIVVDERDDLFYTRAALQAHRPGEGRITVQPTPASSSPAALAHDMLYALGKRLAPGPHSPDVWLDSVNAAWLAAAAWGVAMGVRHVVVPRAHLLTLRRIDQLLAWRESTGAQLTLLWQKPPRGLPPSLARVERRISGRDQFEALLAEPGPIPARPSFPPALPAMTGPAAMATAARQAPAPQPRGTEAASTRPGRQAPPCAGALATAQLVQAAPALEIAPEEAAALTALTHPLIAGALSVLAFTQTGLGSLRFTRDLDISGDVCVIKLHGAGHRHCPLHAVPAWARPLLAGARAHHRLMAHSPREDVFSHVMLAEARHLRAHAGRLPQLDLSLLAGILVP
ncbi:hypothetical protein ACH46N_21790 [Streptomyces pristinaespiralis]|uniref:Uncharacterized protein n=2 Tax=Streptomyces pristinaespiralis TaxID=38300 RepID=B5HB10_STRE2|nr:hypothetical protein [Streptomyces pristinaespiralis]ALC18327.1 AAur_pTC [Streptomyces pristinaespiralis]ALC25638.1 AAur_pTC [Streptomyces pristinaespiralis]EDY64021.2 conserved hypothetical protein [Streptomyces pristinaespiralis ATCC 25486]QMU12188.1 hypothetical protein H3L99_00085 [Streptomyces pristinaespiralis]